MEKKISTVEYRRNYLIHILKCGATREDVAIICGVSKEYVRHWISGVRLIPKDAYDKMLRTYGMPKIKYRVFNINQDKPIYDFALGVLAWAICIRNKIKFNNDYFLIDGYLFVRTGITYTR